MSIVYNPTKLLKRIAPEKKIKKLLSGGLTLKRTALSFISDIDFLSKQTIVNTALKVIRNYKERYKEGDITKSEIKEDPALLINRIQNVVVQEISKDIKENYFGEFYEWGPSSADVPDPQHQLKYGKRYQIGKGEMPGDRFGCRCSMIILVPEKKLVL
jgi:hypothetical protein